MFNWLWKLDLKMVWAVLGFAMFVCLALEILTREGFFASITVLIFLAEVVAFILSISRVVHDSLAE